MRFLPASDRAVLVELDDLPQALALYRQLLQSPIAGVQELVPAARTVLVGYQPGLLHAAAVEAAVRQRWALAASSTAAPAQAPRTVEIPVDYSGPDLPDVAELLGISVAQVIERHTGQPWQAAFAGFAPGFVYLTGGHPCFDLPRRTTPRTQVPAGSVALGGRFSAVYPNASPGGWQLLGTTALAMWDLSRPEPACVQPGMMVQFSALGNKKTIVIPAEISIKNSKKKPENINNNVEIAIEILDAGLQTLVQDQGRLGQSGQGIAPSGALDQGAMRQANRLVGNPIHTPVLESVLGGLHLRSRGRTTLGVAGAQGTLHVLDAQGQPLQQLSSPATVALNDGQSLRIAPPQAGVRVYVAVRGGWQLAPVLGSCATDTLAQIGPPPVQAGAVLAVGSVPPQHVQAVQTIDPAAVPALPRAGDAVVLDITWGPRSDWFHADALALLTGQSWQVTPRSNRIGMRLAGAQPLQRVRHDELPSEGTVNGAIQVPISGQPVLFLADHPLTGGYPVMAAVASHHLDLAAQIPVGCTIRFRVIAAA